MAESTTALGAMGSPPRHQPSRFSEHILHLVSDAQSGSDQASHQLYLIFTPMLLSAITPYHRDLCLYEELYGETYLILHRLIMNFQLDRGVNLFTYLERTLPQAVWSYVRQQRKIARREVPASCLSTLTDDPSPEADPDSIFDQLIGHEYHILAGTPGIDEAITVRIVLETAILALPTRQKEIFLLWKTGHSFEEMASDLEITSAACRQAFKRARSTLQGALREVLLLE